VPARYGGAVRVGPLDRSALPEATAVLAAACAFDRAAEVADEKLFGAGPRGAPRALGAWDGDALVGVAAVADNRIRVLAVAPGARRRGAGSALVAACEATARDAGQTALRTLDQPGNYLAPGIDERNAETIAWLERRGWRRLDEPRIDVRIDVRGNPRVSAARAAELAAAAAGRGYQVRRARPDEQALLDAVAAGHGRSSWRARWATIRPASTSRSGTARTARSPPTTATTAGWAGSGRPAPGRRTAAAAWARRCCSPAWSTSRSTTRSARSPGSDRGRSTTRSPGSPRIAGSSC
jgi:GNAT superfamily N-acetyltransferase